MKKKYLITVLIIVLLISIISILVACNDDNSNKTTKITFMVNNDIYFVGECSNDFEMPIDPELKGYIFKGWYTDSRYTIEFNIKNYIEEENRSDIKVYAKFSKVYLVTLNFMYDREKETLINEIGCELTLPVPERDGYKFEGWSLYEFYFDNFNRDFVENNLIPNKDEELYAMWSSVGYTEGLIFKKGNKLPNGSNGASVQGYVGHKKDIIVPDIYCNVPVNEVNLENTIIENIKMPNTVEDVYFKNCKSLKKINIPNSVTELNSESFRGCTSIIQVKLPNSLVRIGGGVFQDCMSLIEIIIPDSVTTMGNVGNSSVFKNCINLEKVVLSKNLDKIGWWMFSGCSKLNNIIVPKNILKIGDYAFEGCVNLKSLIIPKGTSIVGSAFTNWDESQTIYFEAANDNNFDFAWDTLCKANIVWNYKY